MKKNIITGAVLLVIGMVSGILCSRSYFRGRGPIVQTDTVATYDTVHYSRLDLKDKTYKLDMPKVGSPALVFIPEISTNIIYRDSIRYVTLPREYFYTNLNNVDIWHSGIDSTIDSLNVVHKTEVITKTQTMTNRHALGIGLEVGGFTSFFLVPYGEYQYRPKPWLSVYGRVYYDPHALLWGVGAGAKISIGW